MKEISKHIFYILLTIFLSACGTGKILGFEEKKIGRDVTKQDLLEAVPNAKTVPQIFMYGKHIGGLTDLKKYFEDHDMWRGD